MRKKWQKREETYLRSFIQVDPLFLQPSTPVRVPSPPHTPFLPKILSTEEEEDIIGPWFLCRGMVRILPMALTIRPSLSSFKFSASPSTSSCPPPRLTLAVASYRGFPLTHLASGMCFLLGNDFVGLLIVGIWDSFLGFVVCVRNEWFWWMICCD